KSDEIISKINYSNFDKYLYDVNRYKNANLNDIPLSNNNSIYHSL
ncbi:unnamed protein product, partial [Rotaria sp. Silwood2]